jgi:phosphatidylinositol alpha-1,6-mannosyltransferase
MRVLMLNNEYPPLGGGTGTVNEELQKRFSCMPDLEIDLITSALGKFYEERRLSEHINIYKVPVNNRNIHHSSNRELLTYAARAFPLAYKLHRKERYDVCVAWSAVPAGVVALAIRKLTRLNYIVRVSGPDIPGFEQRYRCLYPLLTPVIQSVWHSAESVVVKSEHEANMIRAVDDQVELSVVPNGVDLSRFQSTAQIPEDGPLKLLCVARLIERKGQIHLIEAVKELKDHGVEVVLDLIGTGDTEQACQARVQQLNVGDRVHFRGYVPRDDIHHYYKSSHVFVLPSYNEGMSVATLEALAAGLPLVVTGANGKNELVEDGVNGFTFDWGDKKMLAIHLRKLAEDRRLARKMAEASRRRAMDYSWETTSTSFLHLIRNSL